jgi:Zn-dependent peptidase ImmA (M78 family)
VAIEFVPDALRISDMELQHKAVEVLECADPLALRSPKRTSIKAILKWLEVSYGYTCTLADLSYKDGVKVLGRTDFSIQEILIEKQLYNEDKLLRRRWPYVIAHEIGHVVVHSPIYPILKEHGVFREALTDTEDIFTGKKILQTERDFVEHHASELAVFLLVPSATISACLKELQKRDNLGESRRGHLYVDDQPRNVVAFDFVRAEMANTYGVSRKLIVSRLAEEGLLIDRRKVPVRIGSAMRELFGEK